LGARATHAANFASADLWTATWDIAATIAPAPPGSSPFGFVALEDSAVARSFIATYTWPNPATAVVFDANYTVFTAAGVAQPPQVPGPAWQSRQRSHWYRQSTTWRF